MPEESKKRKLWEVDPSIFEPGPRANFFEKRLGRPLRQLGKFGLFALAFTYPLLLIFVGLEFGGLAFWAFLVGSTAVMGLTIARLGYASNFSSWDIGVRRMIGVVLGFLVALGFYAGIIYLRTWFVPVAFGLLGIGLVFALRRIRM